jgi:hypothetical protein
MSDDRPGVYVEDGITYYRASELGHCVRRLWAYRSQLERRPFPETIQKAMDTGTDLEPKILNSLYDEHNFTFADGGAQKQVLLQVTPTIFVIGHIDQEGCSYVDSLKREDQPYLPIDVKAFGQKLVTEYRTKGILALQHYAWQQSVYALALGHRRFYMPIYNKDTQQIEPWSLSPVIAPYDLEDITQRIAIVEKAYQDNEMPACTNEYGCPFFYLHDTPPSSIEALPVETIPFVRARIAINKKIKALQSALGLMNDKIIEQLDEGGYTYDGYSIKVLPNPPRFNTDAAKAILKDADIDWENDPLFIIPGSGTQLRIDPPKKPKND